MNGPITFLWPQFLWLLLALPLLLLGYLWLLRRRQQTALRFASLAIVREAMMAFTDDNGNKMRSLSDDIEAVFLVVPCFFEHP